MRGAVPSWRVAKNVCVTALGLSVLLGSSPAFAQAPPHAVYGPMFVGQNDTIRVDLDTAMNVFAVNLFNYELYKQGRSFNYYGGQARKSPVFLNPPMGSYYVVIDNGGDSLGYARAGVQVLRRR
ncbi:MAG: hypothetical protein RL653_122 [Pseudomonadota bacterium]|jgi:hypothetical protein